jgi:hypothetical protein
VVEQLTYNPLMEGSTLAEREMMVVFFFKNAAAYLASDEHSEMS